MRIKQNFFNIEYNRVEPKKGRLLISEPFSGDIFFRRAVVLITEHDESGTKGLILNKKIANNVDFFLKEYQDYTERVFLGGPVMPENIYMLHNFGESIGGSEKIKNNLYIGGSPELIKLLISSGQINKENFKFFLGHAAWEPNQLENELKKNYWLVVDDKSKNLLDHNVDLWRESVRKLNNKYKLWANFPNTPEFN